MPRARGAGACAPEVTPDPQTPVHAHAACTPTTYGKALACTPTKYGSNSSMHTYHIQPCHVPPNRRLSSCRTRTAHAAPRIASRPTHASRRALGTPIQHTYSDVKSRPIVISAAACLGLIRHAGRQKLMTSRCIHRRRRQDGRTGHRWRLRRERCQRALGRTRAHATCGAGRHRATRSHEGIDS